jgi:hypothetical protein
MVGVTKNVCARTSHYVGFDRQSHDFDYGVVTPGPSVSIPSSC